MVTRLEYARKAATFCRGEYQDVASRILPCTDALTRAATPEEAEKRLLCVDLGANEAEVAECFILVKDLTLVQALAEDSLIRKRFGATTVDQAKLVAQKANLVLRDFVPPGPPEPPRVALPVARPAAAPPVPAPPSRTLAGSVLTCIKGANIPPQVLDAIVNVFSDLDAHPGGEESKIDELCHQVADLRKLMEKISYMDVLREGAPPSPEEAESVKEMEAEFEKEIEPIKKFETCLCPKGPAHKSLLQLLANPGLEEIAAAGLVAAAALPLIPP